MLFITDNGFWHKNGSKRVLEYSDEPNKAYQRTNVRGWEWTYKRRSERMHETNGWFTDKQKYKRKDERSNDRTLYQRTYSWTNEWTTGRRNKQITQVRNKLSLLPDILCILLNQSVFYLLQLLLPSTKSPHTYPIKLATKTKYWYCKSLCVVI